VSHVTQARRDRKKGFLATAPPTGPGQFGRWVQRGQHMRNRSDSPRELALLCRFLAGLSPDGSIDASGVMDRRFKKWRAAT